LACDHRAAALLIELLHTAGMLEPQPDALASRHAAAAREYIRAHFRHIADMPEVAAALGVGYDHLRHGFRTAYGMSIKQWHTQVRIERARDLLLHSNLPLKAIADLCGFRNARYFCTCFRRATGQTPGRCRTASATASPHGI
jgi:AraC-like DNA-binding protein